MSTSDHREGTPGGQAKTRIWIERGRYYFTEEVTSGLSISEDTLEDWVRQGLQRPDRKKLKMKRQIYSGDSILDFVFSNQ